MKTTTSLADLHIHTTYSDGTVTVPQLLEHVAAHTDLRVIAVTDHDAIDGAREAQRLARDYGIEVVLGEEVSTAQGHLLCLFIDGFLPPGRPVAETIAVAHAMGGLCVVAHPCDAGIPSLGVDQVQALQNSATPLDGIEVFNAGLVWPRRYAANRNAQALAAALAVPALGSSDAHSLATVGRGVTSFAGRSADDLYRALRSGAVTWSGHCWHAGHYVDIGWRMVRQRSVVGALKTAFSGGALPL